MSYEPKDPTNASMKGVSAATWALFKSMAAKRKQTLPEFFNTLVRGERAREVVLDRPKARARRSG